MLDNPQATAKQALIDIDSGLFFARIAVLEKF